MKKVLVIGASGFIGKTMCEVLSEHFEVYGTYHEHKVQPKDTMMIKYDLGNEHSIDHLLMTIEPDYVISSLRGDFPQQLIAHKHMAEFLSNRGGRLYYLSTVNVYDALTDKAHTETDAAESISDYGNFKINCENMLKEAMGPSLTIIRLPMVFGMTSSRVIEMTSTFKQSLLLKAYKDMYLTIHSDQLLARQMVFLLKNEVEGLFHLGSHDIVGHDEVMATLAKHLGLKGAQIQSERIQDQPYYLALKTIRNELPVDLLFSATQIIKSIA